MDAKTILDTYKRYLHTLNGADADLFTNYGKITDFINSECKESGLRLALFTHCLGKNLEVIRGRGIKIKTLCTEGWSSKVVEEGYGLLRSIKRAEKADDMDAYGISLYRFFKLASKQRPHLQLYLYLCFGDRIGDKLFKTTMAEIEEAARKTAEGESTTAPTE